MILWGQYSSLEALKGWWQDTGAIHTSVQLLFAALTLTRFYAKGIYSKRIPFWDELQQIFTTLLYLALLNGMVVLIAKWPFSRSVWLVSWCAAALLVPIFRALMRKLLTRFGLWKKNTIILGTGETAVGAYKALISEPQLGFDVIQFIQIGDERNPELPTKIPVIQTAALGDASARNQLIDRLKALKGSEVIIALDEQSLKEAEDLIEDMILQLDEIHFVPSMHGLPLFGMEAHHFFSHEVLLLSSRNNLGFRPQVILKRLFDFFGALTILLLMSPLLLWIAFRIRISGPGVLFKQPRWGHGGDTFRCYKFRTMVPNAEAVLKELLANDPIAKQEWEEKTKITNDPRITSIGELLRRTSLDELPQLLNVLKGEMSLVGPRPILMHEVDKYGSRFSFYTHVRPGITGLWQVSGRSDTDYRTRVQLDTWYVKNWTLWYDIAILFKTVKVVLGRKGAY